MGDFLGWRGGCGFRVFLSDLLQINDVFAEHETGHELVEGIPLLRVVVLDFELEVLGPPFVDGHLVVDSAAIPLHCGTEDVSLAGTHEAMEPEASNQV